MMIIVTASHHLVSDILFVGQAEGRRMVWMYCMIPTARSRVRTLVWPSTTRSPKCLWRSKDTAECGRPFGGGPKTVRGQHRSKTYWRSRTVPAIPLMCTASRGCQPKLRRTGPVCWQSTQTRTCTSGNLRPVIPRLMQPGKPSTITSKPPTRRCLTTVLGHPRSWRGRRPKLRKTHSCTATKTGSSPCYLTTTTAIAIRHYPWAMGCVVWALILRMVLPTATAWTPCSTATAIRPVRTLALRSTSLCPPPRVPWRFAHTGETGWLSGGGRKARPGLVTKTTYWDTRSATAPHSTCTASAALPRGPVRMSRNCWRSTRLAPSTCGSSTHSIRSHTPRGGRSTTTRSHLPTR